METQEPEGDIQMADIRRKGEFLPRLHCRGSDTIAELPAFD